MTRTTLAQRIDMILRHEFHWSLALRIPSDHGLLDSESVTRILTTPQRTLIAQLTLTALPESPVDRNNIGLAVTCDVADAAAENH